MGRSPACRRIREVRLWLEQLENWVLLSGNSIAQALGLSFSDTGAVYQTAAATTYLANPDDVALFRISLADGEQVTASANTGRYGGGLNSYLRVFQETGAGSVRQIAANDNFQALHAGLTFQAPPSATGTASYYIGISSFDNTAYDPLVAGSGAGSSRGLFDLNLSKTTAESAPDLVASSFEVSDTLAEWGDIITVSYTVENQGGQDSRPVTVSLLVSGNNRFEDNVPVGDSTVIPGLAAGDSYRGSFTMRLGDAGTPLSPFHDSQRVFLGLQIDSAVPTSPAQGNSWAPVQMLRSESVAEDESNDTREMARFITVDSRTNEVTLPVGAEDFFKLSLTESGNLVAELDVTGGPVSLTLYDSDGIPMVRSDGQSPANPNPLITHGLTANPDEAETVYYLKVTNRAGQASAYSLTTRFIPSVSALETVALTAASLAMAPGDFNGDGLLDLIVASKGLTALFGNGDGTFQRVELPGVGVTPQAVVAGDFNGDGRLDVALANLGASGVRVLLGQGDGTFQPSIPVAGQTGTSLVAADFNGDGRLDLAVANDDAGSVALLLGDGHGGFENTGTLAVMGSPSALAAADFNGDGRVDVAVAVVDQNQVALFLNQGGGEFENAGSFDVGDRPLALAAGDFNGDGRLDLASANIRSGDVSVLHGDGQGAFDALRTYPVGKQPRSVVTGDFNRDGRVDLATVNSFSNDVTVLLGQGTGSLKVSQPVSVGANPFVLTAGDFNGDGRADLVANSSTKELTLRLGNGDGTFPHTTRPNTTGQHPNALVQGDINGDGRLDLAVANYNDANVSVLLGQGDGTLQNVGSVASGINPRALVTGDFNGDGRLDLAIAAYGSNNYYDPIPGGEVRVLLGHGNGSFDEVNARLYDVGGKLTALVAGDFDADGHLDLATALGLNSDFYAGSSVMVLLGDGRGDFQEGRSFTAGTQPRALVSGDFNGDEHLDLATANYYSADFTVLLGDGHGSFETLEAQPAAGYALDLVAGKFNDDDHWDLALATQSSGSNRVTVLLSDGHGTLEEAGLVDLPADVKGMVAGDFNGDDRLDLVTVDGTFFSIYELANRVTVLLGDGHGGLQSAGSFAAGSQPRGIVAADFNGDRRLDLATANFTTATVTTLIGTGTGEFISSVLAPSPVQSTPLMVNIIGTPEAAAVVLTQTGQILLRKGLANQPGAFAPPVVLNPDPSLAARDLALVQTAHRGTLLAALHAHTFAVSEDPDVPRVSRVTLYQPHGDGSVGTVTVLPGLDLPAGFLPANIASADLDGNGLGDLVISAAASDQVFISFQTADGVFGPTVSYTVGVNSSAIELVDVNKDLLREVLVTDRFSGQISVLINQGGGAFSPAERFRAGTGLYGLTPLNGGLVVQSLEGTNGILAGRFDDRPGADLLVINSGSNSFVSLSADGAGGFFNPQSRQTVVTGASPSAVVAGQFTSGDDHLDLAILSDESDAITIYHGDGAGGFTRLFTISAGNEPTGLSVADVTRPGSGGPDGILDLLVGNAFGDLLILPGRGDGTFSDYQRADQTVSLVVADSAVSGQKTFFFSNQGQDELAYKSGVVVGTPTVANPTVYQDRNAGIQAPGPQAVVTVRGTQYLVVANSGRNEVLIYTLAADGRPDLASKQTYFTGTDPKSLAFTSRANDLNGDAVPDLVVANEGSNDVSVFLGQMTGDAWGLSDRPRQSSGGQGPTAVAIADITGADGTGAPDGVPDLLVSNGHSNHVSVLPNRGDGFFINDPASFATGNRPQDLFVGDFDGTGGLDLVTINSASHDVTLVANFATSRVTSTISSGGTFPVAALAVDVNDNGITDLLIANAGSGGLELLLGGPGGFEAADVPQGFTVPHLSDLALVTSGNELAVYGTDAGSEIAVLLSIFGPPPAPPTFLPSGPGFPAGLEIVASATDALSVGSDQPTNAFTRARDTVQDEETGSDPSLASLSVVGEESEDSAEDSPHDSERQMRSPTEILLLNLAEPGEMELGDEPPEDQDDTDFEAFLTQQAAAPTRGSGDLAQSKDPKVLAVRRDLFWDAVGEELALKGTPIALGLQQDERPANLKGQRLPEQPWEGSATWEVVRLEQSTRSAALTKPAWSNPMLVELNSRATPTDQAVATHGSISEEASGEHVVKISRTNIQAGAWTGLWCLLPLLTSRMLDTLERSWTKLRIVLRVIGR
jgi:6-phosphogluconolactonase (cycloisomerase 2 family)